MFMGIAGDWRVLLDPSGLLRLYIMPSTECGAQAYYKSKNPHAGVCSEKVGDHRQRAFI